MKVSVIVPVYNVEKYLARCLDSLVNQTLEDIEIIIVNDGSTDNSENIIKQYLKKYSNIKYFRKANGGLSDARNHGLKYAKGDYVAFVDSDDYVDNTIYEKMYKIAKKNKLNIVVCDTIEVYGENNKIYKHSNFHYSDNNIKNYIISPPMACIRLFKREIFNKVEFTKKIYYEDLNLMPGLVNCTSKIGFIEEGLYYYVQRDNSIMKQRQYDERLLDIFTVLKNNDFLKEKYQDELEYLYITHLLRSASLRFLNYDNRRDLLKKVNDTIRKKYPNYSKNIYYKKSSLKFKIVCYLSYHKYYKLLKIVKRIGEIYGKSKYNSASV